jgi:hypothetical protein
MSAMIEQQRSSGSQYIPINLALEEPYAAAAPTGGSWKYKLHPNRGKWQTKIV